MWSGNRSTAVGRSAGIPSADVLAVRNSGEGSGKGGYCKTDPVHRRRCTAMRLWEIEATATKMLYHFTTTCCGGGPE